MRGKHVELLRLLGKQNTWITAKQMAKQLQVSERSIKNYIGKINYQEENLIEASKNGYRAFSGKRLPPPVSVHHYLR